MVGPKFDINDGDFIFGDDNFGFDSNGHMMHRVGNNTMMDMETGDIHFTVGGNDDDKKVNNLFNNEEEDI